MTPCLYCASPLPGRRARYCGKRCADRAHTEAAEARMQAAVRIDRTRPRTCADCPAPLAAPGRRGPLPRRCPDCARRRDNARKAGKLPAPEARLCAVCPGPMPAGAAALRLTCSEVCAARHRAARRAARAAAGKALAGQVAA